MNLDGREWCTQFDHHDPAFIENPWPILENLREHCPVARGEKYGGFWILTRHEDVALAARTPQRFTSSVPGTTSIPSVRGPRSEPSLPIELDPPLHSRYRFLFASLFSKAVIEDLRPTVTAKAESLISDVASKKRADLVRDFAAPLSLHTLGTWMSLPVEDHALWRNWTSRMSEGSVGNESDRDAAAAEYSEYIRQMVSSRQQHPAGDIFSKLLTMEIDGRKLTPNEVERFGRILLFAGHETTAGAMGMILEFLARHPLKRSELVANPDLIPNAVEELLRLHPPLIMFGRNAAADLELHDVVIPRGDLVALGYGSANRDSDVFDRPNEADFERKPNRHMTFGHGPHLCLGASMARLEVGVMLETVTRHLPAFSLDPANPVRRKSRGDQPGLISLPVLIGRPPEG